MTSLTDHFTAVYGPVESWRFHRSLGIDPIGPKSACSFSCVYCQLGKIDEPCRTRQVFVPTETIQQELAAWTTWDNVNVITLSGSGEPTLARNLGEIIAMVHRVTQKEVAVLTNGSLLCDAEVRAELAMADYVVVKVDAVNNDALRRINRPMSGILLSQQWSGLSQFRQMYTGKLSIQTMLLRPWSEAEQDEYILRMQTLKPDEIQLNTPTRPKPLEHHLEARGNHSWSHQGYPVRQIKAVSLEDLEDFGERIRSQLQIPVRYPLHLLARTASV